MHKESKNRKQLNFSMKFMREPNHMEYKKRKDMIFKKILSFNEELKVIHKLLINKIEPSNILIYFQVLNLNFEKPSSKNRVISFESINLYI